MLGILNGHFVLDIKIGSASCHLYFWNKVNQVRGKGLI